MILSYTVMISRFLVMIVSPHYHHHYSRLLCHECPTSLLHHHHLFLALEHKSELVDQSLDHIL